MIESFWGPDEVYVLQFVDVEDHNMHTIRLFADEATAKFAFKVSWQEILDDFFSTADDITRQQAENDGLLGERYDEDPLNWYCWTTEVMYFELKLTKEKVET